MEHQDFNNVIFATLEGLVVHSSKESIFLTTPLTESINCRSGLFQVDTKSSFFSVGETGDDGDISLTVEGKNSSISIKGNSGQLIWLAGEDMYIQGPGDQPANLELSDASLILSKGSTFRGPLQGGTITLKNNSVIIQAGLAKISVTNSGIVLEVGETKFDLSLAGIKLSAGLLSFLNVGVGEIEMKCGEPQIKLNAIEAEIKGVVTKIQAEAKAAIEGTLAELKAKAINDLTAALQNI